MSRIKPLIAVAAVAAFALTGCSGGGTGSGGAGGEKADQNVDARGPITFAMGSNDIGKLTPIIDAWNSAHPNETVTVKELPNEADQQRDTLVQALQANSTDYDVMALDVTWTAEFAANGYLQPLTGTTALDTSQLLPATVESATYRGTLYGGPQNTNAQLLYYRTDVSPSAPTSWDDLLKACPDAKAQGMDCIAMQLKNYEGLTVQTTQAINSAGGSVVGDDGKTPTVESSEATKGLQALVDAYASGDIAQRATGFTEEETNLAFLAGETAFAYNWPYMYDNAMKDPTSKVADKFAVAAIVGVNGTGASTLGGYNDSININSKYKATALDLIKFIENEDNQKSFADQSFPPVLASVYDDASLTQKYEYLPALKEALENAKPRPVTPFYTAISKAVHDNAYSAITGEKTVEEALKEMSAAITASAK